MKDWTHSLKYSEPKIETLFFVWKKYEKRFASVTWVFLCIFLPNRKFSETVRSINMNERERIFLVVWHLALKNRKICSFHFWRMNRKNFSSLHKNNKKQRKYVSVCGGRNQRGGKKVCDFRWGVKICRKLQFGQFLIDFPFFFFFSWRMKVIHHFILICVWLTHSQITNTQWQHPLARAPKR